MMMLIMEALCQTTTMITILLRSLMMMETLWKVTAMITILLRLLIMMETLWQVTTPPSPGLVLGPEMLI